MRKYHRILLLFLVFLFGGIFFLLRQDMDYSKFDSTRGFTVTYVLIDGMSQEIFKRELALHHLPNMEQLIKNSIYVENGIGSFPSMTGYAFYPFITGHDAPESGILGLRWFDRSRIEAPLRNYVGRTNIYMNRDISDSVKTFFELAGDQYTSSINTYMNRGVSESIMTGFSHTTAKYGSETLFSVLRGIPLIGKSLSKNHFEHETQVTNLAIKQLQHNPKVQWLTYPSPDAQNHVHGTDSTYYQLLCHIDGEIGRLIEAIGQMKQKNTRILAIITDHGISDVSKNLDVCQELRDRLSLNIERGKSANLYSSAMPGNIKDLNENDGFFVINGNLSGYLYLKDPSKNGANAWKYHLNAAQLNKYKTSNGFIDLTKNIAKMEGIELIAYRIDSASIMIENADGLARIEKSGNKYSYKVVSADVLQYESNDLCIENSKGNLTKQEWMETTIRSKFAGAVPRLYEVVSRDNSGDILLCSEKEYDLASNYEIFVGNYKGGHGGLRSELLRVPYIIHIPGQMPEKLTISSSEDVGRMIGDYLFAKAP